jgi:DNA topoisomerase-1
MSAVNKILIIVESPAKCKKIESYLGNDYRCIASYGHLRTISGLKDIDMENGYRANYSMIAKNTQYPKLKKCISECRDILLATDDDREGEAIAWHICCLFSLPVEKTKRIIFHEVTKTAICNAVKNPTVLNMNIVNSQQARQILDIIVGFKISPSLWKNISWNSKTGLSAGRCQTPALRLIYENQKEIDASPGEICYEVTGYFTSKNLDFQLNNSFKEEKEVKEFLELSLQHDHIYSCSKPRKASRSAPTPLTTSVIQQQASNLLKISPKETMKICQKLYESGLITYMRTDSKTFSIKFIETVKEFILNKWGKEYIHEKVNQLSIRKTTKKKEENTQDAHEAIRPTDINSITIGEKYSAREKKMYDLIWRISCGACMSDAILNCITAEISAPLKNMYKYTTHTIIFPGWKILEKLEKSDTFYTYCLSLKQNEIIPYKQLLAKMTLKHIKSHIGEARLVQLLEEKGIGRPSTFSSLVDKIQEREYVKLQDIKGKQLLCKNFKVVKDKITTINEEKIVGNENKKLVIQPIGIIVLEFLLEYYSELFSYSYTKDMEDNLDIIAKGDIKWNDICDKCNNTIDTLSNTITSYNKNIYIDDTHEYTIGKYGPVIKCKEGDLVTFKNVKKDLDLNKLRNKEYKLEDIIENSIPATSIGKYNDDDVYIKKGKFGLYAEWGENKKSLKGIKKNINEITIQDVKKYIDSNKNIIKTISDDLSIRTGKYGDYVYYKTKKMKKPKFISVYKFKDDNILNYNEKEIIEKINNLL